MSAFVVDHAHINAILTFAKKHKAHIYFSNDCPANWPLPYVFGAMNLNDPIQLDWLAQMLLNENVRSVNYRYRESDKPSSIAFVPKGSHLKPIDVLSMLGCYDYQTSETDDYNSTLARFIIDSIRQCAITALPGYRDAVYAFAA